jgi:hypothetical protein
MTDTKKAELKCPYIDPQCHSMGQEGACRHWMVALADSTPWLATGRLVAQHADWTAWEKNCDVALIEHLKSDTSIGDPWQGLDKKQKKILMKTKPKLKQKIPAKSLRGRVCCIAEVVSMTLAESMTKYMQRPESVYSMDRRHNIVNVFDEKNPDHTKLSQDLDHGYTVCLVSTSGLNDIDWYYSTNGLPKGKILVTRIVYP